MLVNNLLDVPHINIKSNRNADLNFLKADHIPIVACANIFALFELREWNIYFVFEENRSKYELPLPYKCGVDCTSTFLEHEKMNAFYQSNRLRSLTKFNLTFWPTAPILIS